MTKMRETKMDVIRFTESDVIVSSGGQQFGPMEVAGFNDETPKNATMRYGDNTYNYATRDLLTQLVGNTVFSTGPYGSHHNINMMFSNEQTTQTLENVKTPDGTYEYDGSVWRLTNSSSQ